MLVWTRLVLLVAAALLGSTTTLASSIDNDARTQLQADLIAWVRSKGGSFSDKLEIRRVDPSDPTSYLGVFAKEPIGAKESLFVIPKSCYLDIYDSADLSGSDDAYQKNLCQLSNKLSKEMELGDRSEYAPYIAYLKTQTPGQLPANWVSQSAKDILREMTSAWGYSYVVDWIDKEFVETGCIVNDDAHARHMTEMTKQRCYDIALIPIWDMVNHDNGRINTENDSMHQDGGLRVRAKRDLEAGEEILCSYDLCVDCLRIDEYWGTPEILRDFGFVENYPHRWVIWEPHDLWFEVYEWEGELEAYFGEDPGMDFWRLPQESIDFLKAEVERFQDMERRLLQDQRDIPDYPWSILLKFHQSVVTDFRVAITYQEQLRKDGPAGSEL